MADDGQYASGGETATAKRKYDDSTAPSGGRRASGFSAPVPSQSPDSGHETSYNSVPPPVSEFERAKQRAQEIAARLLNSAEAKRTKFDNGGGGFDSTDAKGFGSATSELGQRPAMNDAPSVPSSYGYGNPSKKIEIPNGRVGVIIGKGGETIKYLQLQSGAKIQVTRDMDADPNSVTRAVELMGSTEQIAKAEQLIKDVLAEAESGGSGLVSRRVTGQPGGAEQFVMKVPNNKVGLVIGKGGETIKNMQASTGARIQVILLHLPPGDTSADRTLQLDGSSDQIEAAKQLINEVISENRRNQMGAGGGGYSQQGYQARPPTSWAPPAPPAQQGYGYIQPGTYPGAPPQHYATQPPYGNYPQPNSGGYSTGWDPNAAPPQTTQGGGPYDYYNQQQQQQPPQTQAPADNLGYSYNQQGYGQEGYGGYQSGYGQPQPGYDQQQGYTNPTLGYNVPSQTPEGQSGQFGTQGDGTNQVPAPTQQPGYGQQPSPNPAFPNPGSTQPGYGVPPPTGYGPNSYGPPPQKPPPGSQPGYGQQPQLSPSTAQGGYGQTTPPLQPGYGQYAHPDSRTPPGGYGTPGYGPPPYGAPLTNYGGQPQAAYNSSYGSGFSQPPPAYPSDASPATQPAAPASGSIAKASPPQS